MQGYVLKINFSPTWISERTKVKAVCCTEPGAPNEPFEKLKNKVEIKRLKREAVTLRYAEDVRYLLVNIRWLYYCLTSTQTCWIQGQLRTLKFDDLASRHARSLRKQPDRSYSTVCGSFVSGFFQCLHVPYVSLCEGCRSCSGAAITLWYALLHLTM